MGRFAYVVAVVASVVSLGEAGAVPITFSQSAANAAAIQPTVDAFRAALGPLNANVSGSFGVGRREINWDGGPDGFASPNPFPASLFNTTSPRGVVFSTPGTGFQVSANAGVGPVEFGNFNAAYPSTFATFSVQRLFTALGSTVTDVEFFVPGSNLPAFTSAFGAVFTDVDLADTTSLQFFDPSDNSLGTFSAPAIAGANETLSFLGVQFTTERIGRVRITSGNQVLGGTADDVVVMDDFIYAEPVRVVPEPSTALLVLTGALAGIRRISRRPRKA